MCSAASFKSSEPGARHDDHTPRVAHLGPPGSVCHRVLSGPRAQAQLQYFPPVPVAPENMPDNTVSWFTPYLQYIWTYDNNVFRIPSVHNYPPSRADPAGHLRCRSHQHGSVGFDGHWLVSRQSIDYDFEVDENAYVRNTDLNNPSGSPRRCGTGASPRISTDRSAAAIREL